MNFFICARASFAQTLKKFRAYIFCAQFCVDFEKILPRIFGDSFYAGNVQNLVDF